MPSENYSQSAQDYETIAQAIRYLESHQNQQPDLDDLAAELHMSRYHLQRLFSRWVGISPKRFLGYLTREHAKQLLNYSEDLLTTSHDVGLSGPGRLHDLFITSEAMTPGEYKNRGAGLIIRYGFHPSPFGNCLVAVTERGICSLSFLDQGDKKAAIMDLRSRWIAAEFIEDAARTGEVIAEMMALFKEPSTNPMRIYLSGTNFQLKVWEALLQIPAGSVVSYQQIAFQVGIPQGGRAVGNAIADNPLPVLIPCHRVIRKNGDSGKYRFGGTRKKALLGWEMAKVDLMRSKSNLLVKA